jgi:hypothetical protein
MAEANPHRSGTPADSSTVWQAARVTVPSSVGFARRGRTNRLNARKESQ